MLENNHTIHLTLNGESRAFTVEPQETLLHVLRERAHLTGAKKGCDLGECGACTVIMDGRAVNSCCVFAIEADGSTVETIEGIGTADEPHPLQQAFIDAGAIPSGYCTPGMLMAATAPPSVSRSCTAASSAYLSKGLTVLGTPARMRVLVFGSMRISVVSGTCLIQTRMFTRHRPQPSSVLPMT